MDNKPEISEYQLEGLQIKNPQGDEMLPLEESDRVTATLTIDDSSLENGESFLSPEHKDYLLLRHGTVDLDPMPTMDPADPLNWPAWKKNINLVLIAFHGMMCTFMAAGVIPSAGQFAEDFGITLTQASYLTSIQILILGLAPLFWKPFSNRYGRRPVWLISTFCSMGLNIANAKSNSYASQIVTRLLVAVFISPAMAIGSVVVTETFFAKERGQKMGLWTVMVTLGPPTGPLLMGFVAFHTHGWQWIYWIFAITNGIQFILYFFLSPETLYVRSQVQDPNTMSTHTFRRKYLNFGKIGVKRLTVHEFLTPIKLFMYPNILIPTVSYAVTFNFSSVFGTVEIPQIFTPKFGFNAQQIGLQYIGSIIGSVLGEILGGRGSDLWMQHKGAQLGNRGSRHSAPEQRIWLSYIGFAMTICGLVLFVVQMDRIHSYNITPIVGLAIAAFGNQVITTVLVTYTVDCHHEHAASIGVFVNLVRSTWGFIGPFWFPYMLSSLGLSGSGGLIAGIMVVFSLLPVMFIHWKGQSIREKRVTDNSLEQMNTITR